jgi:tRNA1(Val) A37 N6-methylase TrmN6
MMVAWGLPATSCTGIEAQECSVALARRSLAYNGADERCRVVQGDLRHLGVLPAGGRAAWPPAL